MVRVEADGVKTPVLAAILSALHVLSLGVGLGAIFARGRALKSVLANGQSAVRSAFLPDALWGIAALLWIVTGMARLFGGIEKSLDFYLYNGFFWLKMGLFAAIFMLEIVPMLTLIRWRVAVKQGKPVDTGRAKLLVRINAVETALVVVIPFVAAAMVRGLWLFS
jgi:putative membrane protein